MIIRCFVLWSRGQEAGLGPFRLCSQPGKLLPDGGELRCVLRLAKDHMGYIGIYRRYIGIMDKKTIQGVGFVVSPKKGFEVYIGVPMHVSPCMEAHVRGGGEGVERQCGSSKMKRPQYRPRNMVTNDETATLCGIMRGEKQGPVYVLCILS